MLLGRETIYRDGDRVGWLSSAGWGLHAGETNIGLGYVRSSDVVSIGITSQSGSYQLEVAGDRIACQWHAGPLYDPGNLKLKC